MATPIRQSWLISLASLAELPSGSKPVARTEITCYPREMGCGAACLPQHAPHPFTGSINSCMIPIGWGDSVALVLEVMGPLVPGPAKPPLKTAL